MIRVTEDDLDWNELDLPAYQGEPFTGECVEFYRNGRLASLNTYVDGFPDGPQQLWTETGVLIGDGIRRHGSLVGVQRQWYDSGAPKVEQEYDDNGVMLRYRAWDEDGAITEDYVND